MKRIWIVSRDQNDENDKNTIIPYRAWQFLHNVRPVRIPLESTKISIWFGACKMRLLNRALVAMYFIIVVEIFVRPQVDEKLAWQKLFTWESFLKTCVLFSKNAVYVWKVRRNGKKYRIRVEAPTANTFLYIS